MMRQLLAVTLLGAGFVAVADWPFTTTTSLYCTAKCPGTWFGYHDSWLKYVECDVKFPNDDKLRCVEMPQPWIWMAVVVLILMVIRVCCCCCCRGKAQGQGASNA